MADQLNEERKGNDASCVWPRRAAYRRLESSSICTDDARDELESGSCNDAGSQRGSRRLDDIEADIGADFEGEHVRSLLLLLKSPTALEWSQLAIRVDLYHGEGFVVLDLTIPQGVLPIRSREHG